MILCSLYFCILLQRSIEDASVTEGRLQKMETGVNRQDDD